MWLPKMEKTIVMKLRAINDNKDHNIVNLIGVENVVHYAIKSLINMKTRVAATEIAIDIDTRRNLKNGSSSNCVIKEGLQIMV